jgi:hypothetical protein
VANANPTPIIQPDNPFTTWNADELYNPADPDGPGRYVPNVNDFVVDYVQGFFIVQSVNYTTGASVLIPWNLPKTPDAGDDLDTLLGSGPGTVSDSYRMFINPATKPATLALDRRLHLYGTTTTSYKIFLGTDISDLGQVISQFYDQNWNLLGENIPLELVAMPSDINNLAVKAPKIGYTTHVVPDGELCTVVTYDDVGTIVSTCKVLAQNTSFIRAADAATKYIVSISVKSAFLNPADPTNIQFPINMPVANLNTMGVVTYSDGSTSILPIDGTKFQLFGLENYIATQSGQRIPLVLVYNLSADEYNYIGTPSINKNITQEYSATTLPTDGAYSIKMFIFPVWQNAINGYRLQVFLYNLDRQDVYDITSIVDAQTDSASFNPLQYNVYQNVTMAVNLNQVDSSFAAYRYVQTVGITLLRPGTDASGDNWTVTYTPGQSPAYGVGTLAKVTYNEVGNWSLDLTSGTTNLTDWLTRVFYATQPLFDPQSEIQAPQPNIFALLVNGTRYEFPIASWSTILTVAETLVEGSVIYCEWIYRDAQDDLQLGVSGFIVHLQNALPQGQS